MNGIAEYLAVDRIILDSVATSRREVLAELADALGGNDVAVREAIHDDLAARERVSSTGVGGAVAFPHARVDSIVGIRLAFLRTTKPIDFDALDERPVDLFLAVAGPKPARREYLSVLARLSYVFHTSSARAEFRQAGSSTEVRDLLTRYASQSTDPE
jgi:PTS system nitrogen regulatory IIA component